MPKEILKGVPHRESLIFLNFAIAALLLAGCSWELRGPQSNWLVGAWTNHSGRSTDGIEAAIAINGNWIDISARNPSSCRSNPRCGPYAMYEWNINGYYSGISAGYTPVDGLYFETN